MYDTSTNNIGSFNSQHLRAMITPPWRTIIGIITTLLPLAINGHPRSVMGISAHVPTSNSLTSSLEETIFINTALEGLIQHQQLNMKKIKVVTKKRVQPETILSKIDTGTSDWRSQASRDEDDSMVNKWDLNDGDFEKLLADLAKDSVEEIDETFEYDYELESDNKFDSIYLNANISPSTPMFPVYVCHQSQKSFGDDDIYTRDKLGYYDQFGNLGDPFYEEEYYAYDSTSYGSDLEDDPELSDNLALFPEVALNRQEYCQNQERPEGTSTENITQSNQFQILEEGMESLDNDELLLLVEASDIIESNLALEEFITDGDEYLGDDELQLLEDACAYEQCWLSGDEYDESDCDQIGKSKALTFYDDISANQNNLGIEVSSKGAEDLSHKLKRKVAIYSEINAFCARDKLDASSYEHLISSPQIPFGGVPFPPKENLSESNISGIHPDKEPSRLRRAVYQPFLFQTRPPEFRGNEINFNNSRLISNSTPTTRPYKSRPSAFITNNKPNISVAGTLSPASDAQIHTTKSREIDVNNTVNQNFPIRSDQPYKCTLPHPSNAVKHEI